MAKKSKFETILSPTKGRRGGWLKTTNILGLKITKAFWGTELKSCLLYTSDAADDS